MAVLTRAKRPDNECFQDIFSSSCQV